MASTLVRPLSLLLVQSVQCTFRRGYFHGLNTFLKQVCWKLAQRADCWCDWSWPYWVCLRQNDGNIYTKKKHILFYLEIGQCLIVEKDLRLVSHALVIIQTPKKLTNILTWHESTLISNYPKDITFEICQFYDQLTMWSATVLLQVEGFKMNLIYYDLYQSTRLEKFVTGLYLAICQLMYFDCCDILWMLPLQLMVLS